MLDLLVGKIVISQVNRNSFAFISRNKQLIFIAFSFLIMQKQAQPLRKLVTCHSIHQEIQNFIVLLDQQIGQGYFGTVNKAYKHGREQELLAVKIIPHNNTQQQKANAQREIDIIKALGQHPNLVRVLPEKVASQHNFYIFMQYCNEGTLQQKIKQKLIDKQNFTQIQIFQTFFQVLKGYKVLWQKKILHQDLKPQNILIKDGVYKITDFGFSMYNYDVKISKKRQGTLEYMSLEKLTRADYYPQSKSDVYSLGVIFFKMVTGRHPYILRPYEDHWDFIDQLKLSVLRPPAYLRARMSLPMQHLFELIIKMVAKDDKNRVDFDQIYAYIQEEQEYLAFGVNSSCSQKSEKYESQQIKVFPNRQIDLKIVQKSTAFAVPFSVLKGEEQQFEEIARTRIFQTEEKRKYETRINIEKYLFSMRTTVYFFDRLARRLTVQRERKQFEDIDGQMNPSQLAVGQKAIIYLVFLSQKLTKQTLNESRNPYKYSRQSWSLQEWGLYKQKRPNVIDLILKDQQYLQADKNHIILCEKPQSKIKQLHWMIEQSKEDLVKFMKGVVKPQLVELLKCRNRIIDLDDKKELTTLNYILTAIDIIDDFEGIQEKWVQLEGYFRAVETQEIESLRDKVHQSLKKHDFPRSYIEGDWDQENSSL